MENGESWSDFAKSDRDCAGGRRVEMSDLSKRIEPFRALMYNRLVAGDPARVVAPPYDLIGTARQNQLYERSPYNVVRLELAREADRYGAAGTTLAEWLPAGA